MLERSRLRRAMRFVSVLALTLSVLMIAGGQWAFGVNPPSELTTASWQQAVAQAPTLSPGCYQASYPSLQWHATGCKVAPNVPMEPAATSKTAKAVPGTVGDGTDYSAAVAGTISSATGSFDDVSPSITETGQWNDSGAQLANTFSLQLNTEFFSNSPACSGSADPSDCQAWQQFVYITSCTNETTSCGLVYMQYWLIDYDSTCPSGWTSASSDCYTNSEASQLPGGALTAPDLATTLLTGSASAGGNDEESLSFGGQASLVVNADSVLDLAPHWNTAEFNVFGDGNNGEANFGANTTLQAQTTLSDSSLSAPTCVEEGFTAETNNLTLTKTPSIGTQAFPTIVSEQTNASPTTPSCAAAPGTGFTVTFNANGGTGTMSPETADVPTALTANAFTDAGYTFAGWNTAANGSGTAYADGATYPFTASVTLFAQWTANASFTVTFNANGGTGTMSPETANVPAALTANAFSDTGYTFAGWNTAANGSGTAYAGGATYPFTASVTLYAQWTANASHTVTFNANGGTGTMANETHNAPTALTANAFTRTGDTFAGWNTAKKGTGTAYADGAIYPFTANVTLYAQWAKPASQTITFAKLANQTLAESQVTVSATASSGLTVTFTTTTATVCTAGGTNGATIKLLKVGKCTVEANQIGSATYKPAKAVKQSFKVS